MTMDDYRNNLKAAYDPTTPSENLQVILDSFLKFKSDVVNHRAGCPKEVEDVIQHLKEKISSGKVSYSSTYAKYYYLSCNFLKVNFWPIASSLLIGVALMFIQHKYFPPS